MFALVARYGNRLRCPSIPVSEIFARNGLFLDEGIQVNTCTLRLTTCLYNVLPDSLLRCLTIMCPRIEAVRESMAYHIPKLFTSDYIIMMCCLIQCFIVAE